MSFLSCTFAPVSLGAFLALLAGYGIAALTLARNHRAAFAMERRLLGHRRRAQRIPAATRDHARAADAGDDARGAGAAWIIGAQVLHSTLYVGLRWTAAYGELDREWLARLNGEKLIPMLTWSVLAAVTLMLPMLVFEQWPTTYAAIVGVASGPIGAWLGRSAKSFGAARPPTRPAPPGGPA